MERVCHKTIYQALYVQGRGGLRRELAKQLSTGRIQRKPRGTVDGRGKLYREAFTIAERPAIVEDRAVPGHWEGDLVVGTANGSAVGTLVERTTRFVMLLHIPGRHDADSVAEAMIKQMGKLPEQLRQSLTWDRGVEMARYRDITLKLDMPIYFCDPHSPWQRGSNENTNRLLRHWLTKGTDLSRFTAKDLDTIAAKLNARPRPTHERRLDRWTPPNRHVAIPCSGVMGSPRHLSPTSVIFRAVSARDLVGRARWLTVSRTRASAASDTSSARKPAT